jgi:hypothetical protein
MSEKFQLPCECGQNVIVERRQAGTSVACVCGKSLEVPTIRGFSSLARIEQAEEELPPIWGLWQGLVFLGLMIALPAFAFSAFTYRQIPTLNETVVYEDTMRFSPAETWMLWRMYEPGMPKNPSIHSVAAVRGIQSMRLRINIGLIIGIVGLLVSAGGLVVRSQTAKAQRRSRASR